MDPELCLIAIPFLLFIHSEGFPPARGVPPREPARIVAAIEIPIATTVIHTPSKTLG